MKRAARWILTWLLCAANAGIAASFTFAAFGDMPYTEDEEARFFGMIAAMNRAPLAFAINVGDFKNGWSPCTDALFAQRRDWFALLHHPLIYAPGDNEWTDCWRPLGAASDPVERLQRLRRLFFTDADSLGQRKITLARQSAAFPEHARWEHGGIVFVTLNVPGGDNNARLPQESATRTEMVNTWIIESFRIARAQSRGGVVLAMQANPWSIGGSVSRGYTSIMQTITRETQRFGGEVLLIHGDTHRHRIDHPLRDPHTRQPLSNFTRMEVFGSPQVNWLRITVTQENGRVRFAGTPGE